MNSPALADCLLWQDAARSPWLNMAVDETLLAALPELGAPLLRLYRWDRPAASIGYFQRGEAERAPGCALVRRPTGGGLVFHCHDVTFSVLCPAALPLARQDRFASYRSLNQAVAGGLRGLGLECWLAAAAAAVPDRERLVCFATPSRHDLLGPAGKILGGAQRRTRLGLLHQASLEREAVGGRPWEELAAAIVAGLSQAFGWRPVSWQPAAELLARAEALAAARYADPAWTRIRPGRPD